MLRLYVSGVARVDVAYSVGLRVFEVLLIFRGVRGLEGFHTLGFYLIYYSLLGLYNKFRRGSRFDVQSQRGSKARIQIEAAHPSSTQTISRRV